MFDQRCGNQSPAPHFRFGFSLFIHRNFLMHDLQQVIIRSSDL